MEIERFLPLIILWIIWRILSRSKAKHSKQKKPKARIGGIPMLDRFKKPVPIIPTMEKISIIDENIEILPDDAEETADDKPSASLKSAVCMKSSPKITSYSPIFLKKAVVWSEILGTPVGLRED